MTLDNVKSHNTTTATTPQQHHTQAAEHLELAAKSHKEAAKLMGTDDHKGAQSQAKVAHDHVSQAEAHVVQATKKATAMPK
jgi:hypothetical protein